ncbi:tetratricopeptide repeat protein [bacterium]|nr:tetratricopeptide repeat protein [candidate division CSSED10-310 bacterium]
MAKVWKEEDNVFLRKNYLKLSNQELAEIFDVSKKSIQGKLRRLGLHRTESVPEKTEFQEAILEPASEKNDVFQYRPKRLSIEIKKSPAAKVRQAKYVPREQTEKRKRAIREFDNAMSLIAGGDREKGLEELRFIMKTFATETDIMDRAGMYLRFYQEDPPIAEPMEVESAEDYYNLGIWNLENHMMEEGKAAFRKSLELEPDYVDSIYNLACIAAKQNDVDESLRLIEEVLKTEDRYLENIVSDYDFEKLWQDEKYIDLIKKYYRQ